MTCSAFTANQHFVSMVSVPQRSDEMTYVSMLKSRWARTSEAQVPAVSSVITKFKQFVEDNVGLLLVASAQLFFSLMNVGVKLVSAVDPPVHTLEVSAAYSPRAYHAHGTDLYTQLIILRMV